jgi:hypothetical protein
MPPPALPWTHGRKYRPGRWLEGRFASTERVTYICAAMTQSSRELFLDMRCFGAPRYEPNTLGSHRHLGLPGPLVVGDAVGGDRDRTGHLGALLPESDPSTSYAHQLPHFSLRQAEPEPQSPEIGSCQGT